MRLRITGLLTATAAALAHAAAAETGTVSNGLEVHETAPILHSEAPSHLLANGRLKVFGFRTLIVLRFGAS